MQGKKKITTKLPKEIEQLYNECDIAVGELTEAFETQVIVQFEAEQKKKQKKKTN